MHVFAMELLQNTPVRAETQTRIAAPPSIVWDVLTDLERWPDWNPDVRSLKLEGPLAVGTTFRWKSGLASIRSTIRVLEPRRIIAWSGEAAGIRAVHVWRISADRAGTLVWTGETFEGILSVLFRRRLARRLAEALDQGIVALRAECERRGADAAA